MDFSAFSQRVNSPNQHLSSAVKNQDQLGIRDDKIVLIIFLLKNTSLPKEKSYQ